MLLNIRDFPEPQSSGEQSRGFLGSLDLSGVSRWNEAPFPKPVAVEGYLRRRHGEVTVEYTARYELHGVCARCLVRLVDEKEQSFSHPVAEALPENPPDDLAEAPGGMLDMREVVLGDLMLELEPAPLCKEDCKGLCPWCGVNRNEADCGCEKHRKPVDPRFEALRKQISNDNQDL